MKLLEFCNVTDQLVTEILTVQSFVFSWTALSYK